VIPLKDQELIRQKFAQELLGPVKIDLFTQRELSIIVPGRAVCAYCKPTQDMLQELAALSDLITLRVHIWEEAKEEAQRFAVERIPGIVLRGRDSVALKFYGLPGGTEFPSFLETIVDVSRGETLFSPESKRSLKKLKGDVAVRVFVTPTCPYCPAMARAACQLALATPHVKAEVIEVNEFPDLAQRYGVRAVPLTVIDDKVMIRGAVPEKVLVEQVLKAAQSTAVSEPSAPAGPTSAAAAPEGEPRRGEQRGSGLIVP